MSTTEISLTDLQIAKKLISKANSSKKRNIEFDLSFKAMKKVLSSKKCYITGVTLNNIDGHDHQLTIERLDNDKGYVDSNIVACSNEINRAKGSLSIIQITQIYNALVKHGEISKEVKKPSKKEKK